MTYTIGYGHTTDDEGVIIYRTPTIGYGNTTDVRGVPIYRTPTANMINRINMLQLVAENLGVAVALPQGYSIYELEDMATELSSMIEGDE